MRGKLVTEVGFRLPDWLESFAANSVPGASDAERMRFVIGCALRHVAERTGGPFAAAVFEIGTGRLVGLGVNVVTTQGLSFLHAEIVAIGAAQRALGTYDLGGEGMPSHELVTSAEPCAMCFGAIPWSGIRRLVCGARAEDARAIGFDEGAKPADWPAALRARGIETARDVERAAAIEVFDRYRADSGRIYNSREAPVSV